MGDFGGRAEETPVVFRSCDQLPPTVLHFSHRSITGSLASLSSSDSLHLNTHSHSLLCEAPVTCSGQSPALLPQHAAPGGVSSSHGGSSQRSSSRCASRGRPEPHPHKQGKQNNAGKNIYFLSSLIMFRILSVENVFLTDQELLRFQV